MRASAGRQDGQRAVCGGPRPAATPRVGAEFCDGSHHIAASVASDGTSAQDAKSSIGNS
eukprot:CAMPEP_0201204016 /NCGR_PEP_ID=MMETSP0851-20130426/168058_1 /ASSEMBLY_ACC=CAM_ASM_000631 /TAXON_ID=183588 /ORGANISM="Pseudo-nitzschia fraudulenta, Strain WWA7" /LENGTH=58 /DNA_ID=CAMNT_0047492061 /DNA_START=1 /DNA_END=174 /DNA_ORIENTATION=+